MGASARRKLTHDLLDLRLPGRPIVGFTPDPDPNAAAGGAPPAAQAPAASPAGGSAADTDSVTMTRAEYDAEMRRVANREKSQGARSGANDWARSHGFDSPDAVAEIVKSYQAQQAAQMSEVEKAKADADKARAEAEKYLDDAKKASFRANAVAALREANAQDPALLAHSLVEFGVNVDSSPEDLKAAVEEMRKRTPGAFGAAATGTPSGDPGRPPVGGPGGGQTGEGNKGAIAKSQLERIQNRRGKVPIPGMRTP